MSTLSDSLLFGFGGAVGAADKYLAEEREFGRQMSLEEWRQQKLLELKKMEREWQLEDQDRAVAREEKIHARDRAERLSDYDMTRADAEEDRDIDAALRRELQHIQGAYTTQAAGIRATTPESNKLNSQEKATVFQNVLPDIYKTFPELNNTAVGEFVWNQNTEKTPTKIEKVMVELQVIANENPSKQEQVNQTLKYLRMYNRMFRESDDLTAYRTWEEAALDYFSAPVIGGAGAGNEDPRERLRNKYGQQQDLGIK